MTDETTPPFKELTSATFKAMSGKDLEVAYSGDLTYQTHEKQYNDASLPDLNTDSAAEKKLMRGAADMKALRFRYHDTKTHRQNAPQNMQARALFNALEQARCEALGEKYMKGVQKNLDHLLDTKIKTLGYNSARERTDIKASDALHAIGKSAFTHKPIPESGEKIQTLWSNYIESILGPEGLNKLSSSLNNQSDFAKLARRLSENLAFGRIDHEGSGERHDTNEDSDPGNDPEGQNDANDASDESAQQEKGTDGIRGMEDAASDGLEDGENEDNDETPWDMFPEEGEISFGDDQSDIAAGEQLTRPPDFSDWHEGQKPYFVYTTQFDEETAAEKLAEREELISLREKLDNQLVPLQATIRRLAYKLQRKLMAQQQRYWEFNQEDGILDTTRLTRIIADPNIELSYKHEVETPFRDTVVSILIDNSGSMRGRPITIAAICTDVLVRTLERCGVRVEILGFTTSAWKGGKSRELWIQNERPSAPGRLNDLRHIIYKSADTSWRKSKKNIGLMLKEGLLKENIDGEALAWAHNRLARRGENRKILIVISDGAPVDDSTLSSNSANILEQDLRAVIQNIETRSPVELCAIGIGHDVTRYYKNSMKVSDADGLAEALMDNLETLFQL